MCFTKSEADPNLYYIFVGTSLLILVLYAKYLFLTGAKNLIEGCKANLAVEFEMKDTNIMHYLVSPIFL